MSDTPTTEVDVPLETGGAHDPSTVAESTQIVTVHHAPGQPLATQADLDASAAYQAEAVDHVDSYVAPLEYAGIDTRTPDANYETRSNIVRP